VTLIHFRLNISTTVQTAAVGQILRSTAGVRRGAFTCVGWKVTLCDPIWQVTSRTSEVGFPQEELYRHFLQNVF